MESVILPSVQRYKAEGGAGRLFILDAAGQGVKNPARGRIRYGIAFGLFGRRWRLGMLNWERRLTIDHDRCSGRLRRRRLERVAHCKKQAAESKK